MKLSRVQLLLIVLGVGAGCLAAFRPANGPTEFAVPFWQSLLGNTVAEGQCPPATPQLALDLGGPPELREEHSAPAINYSPKSFIGWAKTALQSCGDFNFENAPDYDEFTGRGTSETYNLIARRITGTPLVRDELESRYAGNYARLHSHNYTLRLNPEGVQKLFDALYISPNNPFAGHRAQQVYNASFKAYVRAIVEMTAAALASPDFKTIAQQYAQAAYTNADSAFDGVAFLQTQMPQLSVNFAGRALLPNARAEANTYMYFDRVLGILIRRHLDGSLNTLLGCLNRVIRDYDLETFAQYGDKLVLRP